MHGTIQMEDIMEKEFKRLERRLVQKGSILNYYRDTIAVPNGNIVEWDFIGHQGAAAVVPVTDDGKLLMVRQYRNALDRYTLEIPAGGRDSADEDFAVCAARELEEEIGYRSDEIHHLVDYHSAAAYTSEKIGIYYTEKLIPSRQHLDENEFVQIEKYTLEELTEMIFDGRITDGKTIAAIMAYRVLKKK